MEHIDVRDLIALLDSLSQSHPSVVGEVAHMLHAASNGRELQIDPRGLPIDPTLLQRLLESAGNSNQRPNALLKPNQGQYR